MSTEVSKGSKVSAASVTVKIARTPDEFAMAMAIRAAVFLAEEDNIVVAAHLLVQGLVHGLDKSEFPRWRRGRCGCVG